MPPFKEGAKFDRLLNFLRIKNPNHLEYKAIVSN
jgi:hypothetical protein